MVKTKPSSKVQPKLVAVSNFISFVNPKVPLYPRLAQEKSWDERFHNYSARHSKSICTDLLHCTLLIRQTTIAIISMTGIARIRMVRREDLLRERLRITQTNSWTMAKTLHMYISLYMWDLPLTKEAI